MNLIKKKIFPKFCVPYVRVNRKTADGRHDEDSVPLPFGKEKKTIDAYDVFLYKTFLGCYYKITIKKLKYFYLLLNVLFPAGM